MELINIGLNLIKSHLKLLPEINISFMLVAYIDFSMGNTIINEDEMDPEISGNVSPEKHS